MPAGKGGAPFHHVARGPKDALAVHLGTSLIILADNVELIAFQCVNQPVCDLLRFPRSGGLGWYAFAHDADVRKSGNEQMSAHLASFARAQRMGEPFGQRLYASFADVVGGI